jgi:CBS domain-containing protein
MDERTVQNSMPRQRVISVPPDASVHKAAVVMTQANCGSVLIMQDGKLLGILTERDLMTRVVAKALDPAATPVTAVMTRNPRCVPPETTVSDAIVIMIERGFRHLPVVNSGGKIVGVFSVRDALPRELGAAESMAEFNEQMMDAGGG